jgi:hypothetical protein
MLHRSWEFEETERVLAGCLKGAIANSAAECCKGLQEGIQEELLKVVQPCTEEVSGAVLRLLSCSGCWLTQGYSLSDPATEGSRGSGSQDGRCPGPFGFGLHI